MKLTLLGEFPLEGFTRLNPAGDERHLFVSEDDSFRLLDLGGYSVPHGDHDHHHATRPTLTDLTYDARHPGHVVVHDGRTVLYGDGDGTVRSIDSNAMREGHVAAEGRHVDGGDAPPRCRRRTRGRVGRGDVPHG